MIVRYRSCKRSVHLLLVGFASCLSGCLTTGVKWHEPTLISNHAPDCSHFGLFNSPWFPGKHQVEDDGRVLYDLACQQQKEGLDRCVDSFFAAAVCTADSGLSAQPSRPRGQLHRSALQQLVIAGQRFGRLDPSQGLDVVWLGKLQRIPIEHHGFVWQPEDFDHLVPIGDYQTNAMHCLYRYEGAGIPLVATTCNQAQDPLLPEEFSFPATLCLRCNPGSASGITEPALELYDPLRRTHRVYDDQALARDLSAPIAYRLRNRRRTILSNFVNPDQSETRSRLYFLEPYQADKIPVILIHGLLSDPYTWVALANELRASPWFVAHYQLWVFEYPTGRSFLASSAELREQLIATRALKDPDHEHPQFSRMVLVGHSLGGLVSKLQVTGSGDSLWQSIATRPIEEVHMAEELRQEIRRSFFFEPSTDIERVIFIGTPHKGATAARRAIGRLGSDLVRLPQEYQQLHDQLIACNPGVFTEEVENRIPTSIDLLRPDSQLLQAIAELPIDLHRVRLHSVIGDTCHTLHSGRSDSVVPVDSARENRAISEILVEAPHEKLNKSPDTIWEVKRILWEHAHEKAALVVPPQDSHDIEIRWQPRIAD